MIEIFLYGVEGCIAEFTDPMAAGIVLCLNRHTGERIEQTQLLIAALNRVCDEVGTAAFEDAAFSEYTRHGLC